MTELSTMDRRRFLRNLGASAGLVVAPPALIALTGEPVAAAATADAMLPFIDHYTTNVAANLTATTNAAVDILSGMASLWQTGSAWNDGVVLAPEVLRASMLHSVRITTRRTEEQAKKAFIYDRQDQSYAMIDGLGPLAGPYKTGAKAVTSIVSAPDGTPASTINDAVPPGAPAGSATGAGATSSGLGSVVTLVQTLRGSYSSGNPAKFAVQYPRPWRMTVDSQVVDTGSTDAYGYPIYKSDVVVAPQLLRQRSLTPATDGGYVSGHTNAFFLACLALAYAVPERFQELVTRAFELADTRIIAGMHSVVDVVGGRILATALAAAILNDPANATIKAAARNQALAYFEAKTDGTLYDYAHSAGVDTDPYADREANARAVAPRLTYTLPRRGRWIDMTVPKGAEVLLETRQPYLDAAQRREVLRTTALPSGYPLLDGPESWGRLNLFAAADGYGRFDRDVLVTMNAADGGFSAADAWRNDIDGRGGLVKLGTGTLALTGANAYTGGTRVQAGTLVAESPGALGRGGVQVSGGTLRLAAAPVRVCGGYTQAGGTLEVTVGGDRAPALVVDRATRLSRGSALSIRLPAAGPGRAGDFVPVISTRWLTGRFDTITVDVPGLRAEPRYTAFGLFVRLTRG